MLHTALAGRPGHADYAPCSFEELKSRGYDYWALGHVHEFEVVSTEPHVIFPGNVQGRTIRETGAKRAVLVAVDDGEVASVERIRSDEHTSELQSLMRNSYAVFCLHNNI